VVREVAAALAGRVAVVLVNTEEYGRVAARLGVHGIPVIFLLQKGKVLEQLAGRQAKESILALVARHVRS
jgi:thioredoxin-like negative regulator of GroEL